MEIAISDLLNVMSCHSIDNTCERLWMIKDLQKPSCWRGLGSRLQLSLRSNLKFAQGGWL